MKAATEPWIVGFLTDYQVWSTFISAFVGFGGVILTLFVQRKHDREFEAARLEAERQRYIAALTTELVGVRSYAQGAIAHLTNEDEFLFPKKPPFVVFDVLSHKMDLLTPSQVQAVRHCYVWLREISARASLLQEAPSNSDEYIRVAKGRMEIIQTLFRQLEVQADLALRELGWSDP